MAILLLDVLDSLLEDIYLKVLFYTLLTQLFVVLNQVVYLLFKDFFLLEVLVDVDLLFVFDLEFIRFLLIALA